jgi:hypothetical protein
VIHDEIHIVIIGEEAYPVRIGAGKMADLSVDAEVEPVDMGEARCSRDSRGGGGRSRGRCDSCCGASS